MADIRPARFPADHAAVLEIFTEFVLSPSVSLEHQGYAEEFANLPGKYAPPQGRLLLATEGERVQGCVALRKVDDSICEMKRLYVRPEARGMALGRRLAEAIVAEARGAGYAEMRLDVLAEFEAAREIYRSMGFVPAEAVSYNPLPGTAFLGLDLRSGRNERASDA
jgi:ribosomal protein S18 acetylase RimI-like enzyme